MAAPNAKTGTSLGPLIRQRRRKLSMTLQDLGARSGVSVGYLSQVERDNSTPTLGTLEQIASALGVGVDYFISTPRPADAMTREADRPRFSITGSSIHYEQLSAEFPGHELTSYVLHVPPGYVSETVSHEGEEIIYILDGTITQVVDGQAFEMTAGDSMHYLGNRPHSWSNPTDKTARILWAGKMMFGASNRAATTRPALATTKQAPDEAS